MNYLCADFIFSRFGFFVRTESQTESQSRMIAIRYTHTITVGVSNRKRLRIIKSYELLDSEIYIGAYAIRYTLKYANFSFLSTSHIVTTPTMLVGVGRMFESVCFLFVCLSGA